MDSSLRGGLVDSFRAVKRGRFHRFSTCQFIASSESVTACSAMHSPAICMQLQQQQQQQQRSSRTSVA
jgi:hypothetical protein